MKSEVMLFVRDAEASPAWYQALLEPRSRHGGPQYEMIVDEDGTLVLQFHRLAGEEHGVNLENDDSPRGAGVLVYVKVRDARSVHARAVSMGADVVTAPAIVELAGHTEFIVQPPDGYSQAIHTRGDVGG